MTPLPGKRTRGEFARSFLRKIGAPLTRSNMIAMMAWMQAEGDAGRFNPLNTTMQLPGSTRFNSVGVQNYRRFRDGVKATADTLNFGARLDLYGYHAIRHGFHISAHPHEILMAVESSLWGTGGLAVEVYLSDSEATLLGYKHHRLAQ